VENKNVLRTEQSALLPLELSVDRAENWHAVLRSASARADFDIGKFVFDVSEHFLQITKLLC
jgi:hypothetical protein